VKFLKDYFYVCDPKKGGASLQADIEQILLKPDAISSRVDELADEIMADFPPVEPNADSLMIVPVLTGSLIFVADLVRRMPHMVRIEVVTVTSYPGTATESRGAKIVGELPADLTDRHVLIVDDIFDTGRTIEHLKEQLSTLNPASIKTCVLLRKPDRVVVEDKPDYVGFDIPDEFVVGYGLDFDGHYRNLPFIGTLHPDAISSGRGDSE